MVDLRPLLFINFLLLLLLITAGFTPVSPFSDNLQNKIPEPLVTDNKTPVSDNSKTETTTPKNTT